VSLWLVIVKHYRLSESRGDIYPDVSTNIVFAFSILHFELPLVLKEASVKDS